MSIETMIAIWNAAVLSCASAAENCEPDDHEYLSVQDISETITTGCSITIADLQPAASEPETDFAGPSIPAKMMAVYKPYIVTKASIDGTFERGDHISLNKDGSINCTDAGGWIEKWDVAEAIAGVMVKLDKKKIESRKRRLLEELAELG